MWNDLFTQQNLGFSGPPTRPLWIDRWCAIKTWVEIRNSSLWVWTRFDELSYQIISDQLWHHRRSRDGEITEKQRKQGQTNTMAYATCVCVCVCVSDTETQVQSHSIVLMCNELSVSQVSINITKKRGSSQEELRMYQDTRTHQTESFIMLKDERMFFKDDN